MVEVIVSLVVDNHRPFIATCLESLLSQKDFTSFRVVVVDNRSTDGTRGIVESFGDRVNLIVRDKKYSFSSNNNIVFQKFSANYFLVLNPDTVLSDTTISQLHQFMESHPRAGAAAPKLVFPDGSLQFSCRKFPTPHSALLRRTPIRYLFAENMRGRSHLMEEWDHEAVRDVDWVLAACVIFRSRTLRETGYFDEGFRLYCEDIDLCYRIWKAGWEIYYLPHPTVLHNHLAKSDKKLLSRYSLWHYRSMIRYIAKHGIAGFRRPAVTRRPL